MRSTPLELAAALSQIDVASIRKRAREAEELRSALLQRFPLDRWPSMRLEDYALGQADSGDTFCHWMEFGSQPLGSIRGGSAYKLVIFKRKNSSKWEFPKQFEEVGEAWDALRSDFVAAFDLARSGDWAAIDGLEVVQSGAALLLKTLHLYFPDGILPIYSQSHMLHYLRHLDPGAGAAKKGRVALNRGLLQALRRIPELEGWSTQEMAKLLYQWAHPRDTRRVVKIAPGEKGRYWGDCHKNGYICVGWDEVGDLNAFEGKEEFREAFEAVFGEQYNHQRHVIARKANELWKVMELEPGDQVVANRGISKILAVGTVNERGYAWDESRPEYRHTLGIDWDTSFAQEIEPQGQWATVTVGKVPPDLWASIAKHKQGPQTAPAAVDPMYGRVADALDRKGQVILYGPPGTGKTYTARRFAVWWLLRSLGDASAATVLSDPERFEREERRLSTVNVTRRAWVAVANPHEWKWEQLAKERTVTFRKGRLKRNYPLLVEGDLVFGYQSTPDKRLIGVARVSRVFPGGGDGEPAFEVEHVGYVPEGPTYEELQADSVLQGSEPVRMRFQGTLFALNQTEAERLTGLLEERSGELGLDSSDEVGLLTRVTFHPSYSYEDFVEGFRPVESSRGGLELRLEDGLFKRICRAAQADSKRNYLILIDEFNRGNVAKILGELMTLLERDKRNVSVVLPQSKEPFVVPPNVYLIGTMNTADRSIKLLDAALRRRFAFVELMPDLDLLSGARIGGLALDEFLQELNRRIAEHEGREKQIGHAYLLDGSEPVADAESFAQRFREDILPLLQEYCYEDYSTLERFIGELVDAEARSLDTELMEDADQLVEHLARTLGGQLEQG